MDKRATRAVGVSIAIVVGMTALFALVASSDSDTSVPVSSGEDATTAMEMIGGCPKLRADAPDMWTGSPVSDEVNARIGPGTEFAVHESGTLFTHETVYVLQECEGWVQGRVMDLANVRLPQRRQ